MRTDLDKRVDVVKLVMANVPGTSRAAATNLLAKGNVSIDGHTIALRHTGRWTGRQLYGRILRVHSQEYRLFGSRLIKDFEQMRMDGVT